MKKSCVGTTVFAFLVCLLILSSLSFYASADSNWRQYKSGPGRTGASDSATSDNKGGLAWLWMDQSVWEDWHGFPTPCVNGPDGTIYFGLGENSNSGHGELVAVNPNGTTKWVHDLPGEVLSSPAIGIDGTVLVTDGKINAISPDGVLLWNRTGSYGPISGPPLVTDSGVIYAAEEGGGILCLDKEGSEQWEITDDGVYGTPTMATTGGILYTTEDNGQFWMKTLDPNGSLARVSGPFQSKITTPCVSENGTAYIGSEDGRVYAISPQGFVVWTFTTVGPVRGSPSLHPDGTVFACTGYQSGLDSSHWEEFDHQRLYALLGNGTLKWSVEGWNFLATPSISTDNVFVTSGGRVVCYSTEGEERWSYTYYSLFDRWYPTSIAIGNDGTVYVEVPIAVLALDRGTPGQVQNLKGELWGKSLSLTWDEPESLGADTITEYRIYVSRIIWGDPSSHTEPELLSIIVGDQRTFTYDNASLYDFYRVTAVNQYGESVLTASLYVEQDMLRSSGYFVAIALAILVVPITAILFLNRRRKVE